MWHFSPTETYYRSQTLSSPASPVDRSHQSFQDPRVRMKNANAPLVVEPSDPFKNGWTSSPNRYFFSQFAELLVYPVAPSNRDENSKKIWSFTTQLESQNLRRFFWHVGAFFSDLIYPSSHLSVIGYDDKHSMRDKNQSILIPCIVASN